jgi:hypothetical protein
MEASEKLLRSYEKALRRFQETGKKLLEGSRNI